MHALAHFDFAGVMRFNPLAPLVVLLITAIAAHAVYVMARDGNVQALGEGPVGSWTVKLLVVALGFQVLVWALRFFGFFGGPCPV